MTPKRLTLLCACALFGLLGSSWAQDDTQSQDSVQSVLAALANTPDFLELQATLQAAQAELQRRRSPLSVAGEAEYRYDLDSEVAPVTAEGSLSYDPLIWGDDADELRRAGLRLELAELDYLQDLAELQNETLLDVLRLGTLGQALEVRRLEVRLAAAAVRAAAAQLERGVLTPSGLREAELALERARLAARAADGDLSQLEAELSARLGETFNLPIPQVETPAGPSAARLRAEVARSLAAVELRSAERALWPVVSAGYTQGLGGGSSLGASVDSGDLSPTLSFDYNPGDPDSSRLSVGVSADFAPAEVSRIEAERRRLQAAELALSAAERDEGFARARLERNLLRAAAERDLAAALLSAAEAALTEALERASLGLTSPLDTLSAEVSLSLAALELRQADIDYLEAQLAFLPFSARPLGEVTP